MSDQPASGAAATTDQTGIRLISFGYLHASPPVADLVLDVRRYLRDPAAARDILDRDGREHVVQDVVLRTAGAAASVNALTEYIAGFPDHHECVVAIGCAGGRHQSVALAELVAETVRAAGRPVDVTHLHVHLPRVLPSGPAAV
jgi:RNase adaptor protein for sRNA GlmZ degradation